MIGIRQKNQDLVFQTEQTVNRKKSGFRAAPSGGKCKFQAQDRFLDYIFFGDLEI